MSWTDNLRPASWRGVEFGVETTELTTGRENAVHLFPFRDEAWVEDMGRSPRHFGLTGFLVGDDLDGLLSEMQDAVEEEGPGELVHPIKGVVQASCLRFHAATSKDRGRVIEVSFLFMEGGAEGPPAQAADLGGLIGSTADAATAASSGDFLSQARAAFETGADAVNQAKQTAQSYMRAVDGAVRDVGSAVSVVGMVVPGVNKAWGRFSRGYRATTAPARRGLTTVGRGLNGLRNARAGVERLSDKVSSIIGRL